MIKKTILSLVVILLISFSICEYFIYQMSRMHMHHVVKEEFYRSSQLYDGYTGLRKNCLNLDSFEGKSKNFITKACKQNKEAREAYLESELFQDFQDYHWDITTKYGHIGSYMAIH